MTEPGRRQEQTSLGGWWADVVSGRRTGLAAALARGALGAAAPLYGLIVRGNLAIYETGVLRRQRVDCPVVSVGNLTVGGTGKTTVAAYLTRWLQQQGRRVAIVSRGHGRRSREPLVIADGEEASVGSVGDEPLMLARQLPGCVVTVGKWREEVIRSVLEAGLADVAVLDDGAQYFRLARDVEIILMDALDDLADERLFPRGRLREPLSHLRRADAVIVTHADLVPKARVERVSRLARGLAPEAPVALARHRPTRLRRVNGEEAGALDELAGARVLAVSGLGRPESFEDSLRQLGAEVIGAPFGDHHLYDEHDVAVLRARAETAACAHIVTTAKDAVRLEGLPGTEGVIVVECELELLEGEEELQATLADRLEACSTRAED